jgi:hypothetical protein
MSRRARLQSTTSSAASCGSSGLVAGAQVVHVQVCSPSALLTSTAQARSPRASNHPWARMIHVCIRFQMVWRACLVSCWLPPLTTTAAMNCLCICRYPDASEQVQGDSYDGRGKRALSHSHSFQESDAAGHSPAWRRQYQGATGKRSSCASKRPFMLANGFRASRSVREPDRTSFSGIRERLKLKAVHLPYFWNSQSLLSV